MMTNQPLAEHSSRALRLSYHVRNISLRQRAALLWLLLRLMGRLLLGLNTRARASLTTTPSHHEEDLLP
jgi:hypothetical protein